MATRNRSLGISHVTVVPTNADQTASADETTRETDADDETSPDGDE
jgi:hypothetical protein